MLVFKDILGHEQIKEHLKLVSGDRQGLSCVYTQRRSGNGAKIPCKCLCTELLCEKGKPEPVCSVMPADRCFRVITRI